MTFMHDGGIGMWVTLVLFLASAAGAVVLRSKGGWKVGVIGAVAVIGAGLSSFAAGLYLTTGSIGRVPADERLQTLAAGISESVNNAIFAGVLAFVLALIALGFSLSMRSPKAAS